MNDPLNDKDIIVDNLGTILIIAYSIYIIIIIVIALNSEKPLSVAEQKEKYSIECITRGFEWMYIKQSKLYCLDPITKQIHIFKTSKMKCPKFLSQ